MNDAAVKIKDLPMNNSAIKPKTVFVGMSGGVDSSVTAVLLKNAGYHVVGVYMKNWSKDLPGMKCPWAEDLADAKRVATKLDIDFRIFDFETEYHAKVVDYMIEEFRKGNTPNPDVMCNQEIKFKLFYDIAMSQGADFIATGHYAVSEDGNLKLAIDTNKDQTYFLYRISDEAIAHTLFPLGKMLKPEVKQLAAEFGLDNAYKKESMGVCFVGEVGIKDFLQEYIEVVPGQIIDRDTGEVLGTHEGAVFYTIGQRHGLNLGGGLPYYVVGKDMSKNLVYVSKNLNHLNLWTKTLKLKDVIIRQIHQATGDIQPNLSNLTCRVRHRAPLISCSFNSETNEVTLKEEIKHPAAGQSVVFYAGDICIGGGIIAE